MGRAVSRRNDVRNPVSPICGPTDNLFEMPDGIFETALGTYYMGVRVINRWGLPFSDNNVLDITAASRAQLAMRGIFIIDAWSNAELASLGQIQKGSGMVLGPLAPGAARTVYFKVDVSAAAPRKHDVEFVCRNVSGMADPADPARRMTKQIFVSRTRLTRRPVRSSPKCRKARSASSSKNLPSTRKTARKGRHRCKPTKRHPQPAAVRDRLRRTLGTCSTARRSIHV